MASEFDDEPIKLEYFNLCSMISAICWDMILFCVFRLHLVNMSLGAFYIIMHQ